MSMPISWATLNPSPLMSRVKERPPKSAIRRRSLSFFLANEQTQAVG